MGCCAAGLLWGSDVVGTAGSTTEHGTVLSELALERGIAATVVLG